MNAVDRLNSATEEDLEAAGIPERDAQRIILYRNSQGPFLDLDSLTNVSGIGPRRVEQYKQALDNLGGDDAPDFEPKRDVAEGGAERTPAGEPAPGPGLWVRVRTDCRHQSIRAADKVFSQRAWARLPVGAPYEAELRANEYLDVRDAPPEEVR